MAGRPKKKPEYNPELQFNNFLQELRDAYEEADSLRSLADELNISLEKFNKGVDRIVEYSYSFKQVRQLWYPIVVPAGRLPSQYISFHQKSAPQA